MLRVRRVAQRVDLVDEVRHPAEERADPFGCGEVRRAVGGAKRRAAIAHDDECGRVDLPGFGHAHGVGAGQQARPLRGIERDLRGRRHAGRRRAHRPVDAIDARTLRSRQRVDHVPLGVEHFEFQLAEDRARGLIIRDDRAVLGILAHELRVASGPTAAGLNALLDGASAQEDELTGQHARAELA